MLLPAFALLLAGPARGETPPTCEVRLEVATPGFTTPPRLRASTTWLGEARTLSLTDHGADPRDRPGDQVWFGAWTGAAVRALPVRLELEADGRPRAVIYEGTERIEGCEDRLAWEVVEEGGRLHALRVARPLVGEVGPLRRDAVQTLAAAAWALLVLNFAGWLWWGRRREAA